ncbi:response regulator [Roseomonas frigidaquae]|uniref:Response regulator n=1 Tax=Falsiroseomonas frigidaquae TaxID=487318 RepID=A0ABX1F1V9_9PROT|nr:response regulator [Falsiroseomonas frigidaquae]NKE46304.1 response regulator [Falsiroseomonas frigidaquae]
MAAVLVLDDSATMVMSLSRILKNAGHTVDTGADGREGVAKLTGGLKPAIILTDLNMPNMDGIAFIKEARRNAATRFTPIVVLTTESSAGKREEARAAGASAWLIKPTEPNALLSTLKQLLPAA